MRVVVTSGDILDVPADILICSANIYLRLSGGVGGALRLRFGNSVADKIQEELDAYLQTRTQRHVAVGDAVATSGQGSTFRTIIHAVAVDGMYHASVDSARTALSNALVLALADGRKVALTALATGYGNLAIRDFARAAAAVLAHPHQTLAQVTICVRHTNEAREICHELNRLGLPADFFPEDGANPSLPQPLPPR